MRKKFEIHTVGTQVPPFKQGELAQNTFWGDILQ
jgi:hypothetical protein